LLISAPIEVNMLVVRENTECLLSAKERTEQDGNTAIAERVITRNASRRIAMMAFQQVLLCVPGIFF
jgi:homoisocitrate dehydrogenase